MIDWLNTVIAVAGLLVALFALMQTQRSNRAANEANNISREANTIAKQAMHMQEEEGKVRLVVKPQIMHMVGDRDDHRARPMVAVTNLSAFPITIEKIWFKTAHPTKGFYWKNPTLTSPFGSFPARLESRQTVTAIGVPDCFDSLDDLLSVTAAVACTECGEKVEGMSPQWQEYCAEARAKGKIHWS